MTEDQEQFKNLFEGAKKHYGVFIIEGKDGNKQVGRAATMRGDITDKMIENHLNGIANLGLCPINEQSECKWGAIDVDDYTIDYITLLNKLLDTALICCKSKSGGAHLFVFSKDYMPAKQMRGYLRSIISLIGLGKSEIFPKQDKVYSDRGDVGNWLNLPYFGNTRMCIKLINDVVVELKFDEFIRYILEKQVTNDFFSSFQSIDYNDSPIKEGPPCLQIMSLIGFPEHTRNISLFNLGVYLKKASPDKWKKALLECNGKLVKPALSLREIETIIKSLEKKDYSYQCHEEPLCSYCNAKLCRTRRFGISNIGGMPIVNSVTKMSGDISMWFINVEGGKLELTSDELFDNYKFRLRCLNYLSIMPPRMNSEQWGSWIQDNVLKTTIEIKDEVMFERSDIDDWFQSFIPLRLSSQYDDLYNNRGFFDEKNKEIIFKPKAFVDYLRFRKIDIHKARVMMFFKQRGSRDIVTKDSKGRSIRCMIVPLTEEEFLLLQQRKQMDEAL